MPATLEVDEGPEDARGRWEAARAVALHLGQPLAEARGFVNALPQRWPRSFESVDEAHARLAELGEVGLVGRVVGVEASPRPCTDHPTLRADVACADCDAPLCSLCLATSDEEPRCRTCRRKRRRSRGFFALRVTLLLSVLVGVLLYAYGDVRQRRLRTTWERTLLVSLVVVPREPLNDEAIEGLRARTAALEERLADQMARYRDGPRPFDLELTVLTYGLAPPPPRPPEGPDDWWGALTFNLHLSSWVDQVEDLAGLSDVPFDASVFLWATAGDDQPTLTVEGTAQQGGRVGLVEVDLTASMVDSSLFVAAHELFHILGATDKYDASGQVQIPEGLADPDREPRFPQDDAALMARHRPISPTESVMPEHLDELAIGPATAREIHWIPSP